MSSFFPLDSSGGTMISNHCSFKEFSEALVGKSYDDALLLTIRETEEAERMMLGHAQRPADEPHCGEEYVETLKQFVEYLRSSIHPYSRQDSDSRYFETALAQLKPPEGVPPH
jgi:hypothetical protein